MERNLTDAKSASNLRRCHDFFVTYYWTLPATGMHLYTNAILMVVDVVLSLVGTFANLLIITAFAKRNRLRTLSNMLLVTLACSDVLVTAVVQPLHAVRMLKEIYGTHNCLLWTVNRLTYYFCCGVSLLTVTIITLERFITLAFPFRHQSILTMTRAKVIIASTWLGTFSFVVSHLNLFPYTVFLSISASFLSLSGLTVISIWLWIRRLLCRHKNTIEATQRPSTVSQTTTSRKQVFRNTRTSFIVVLAVFLCYSPSIVMLAYYSTQPNNFVVIFVVFSWLEAITLANSVLNPVLLFWRSSDFRNTAKELLFKLRCEATGTREQT